MGASDRVKQYIDYKGISKYKFCKDLGFSNKFLDNSSNMGTDKACKILHHYPEVNAQWLLTGEGEMLKSGSSGGGNEEVLAENARLKERVKSLEEMKQLQQELITSLKQQLGNAHAHSSKAS